MTKKWGFPFLLLLPFIPLLLWGIHLPDAAYASLRFPGQAAAWPEMLVNSGSGYQAFSTSLFPIVVGLLARLGLEPAAAAALLSTLGWGTTAVLMWWLGRRIKQSRAALVAAGLFCFNPWIIATLGQATGWIVAIVWLVANFALRKRILITALGTLFLLSLFFRPSQGFTYRAGLAEPLLWSLLLFAAALGAQWLANYFTDNDLIALDQKRASTLLLGLLSLLILLWQGSRLWQEWNSRPLLLWSVEEDIAAWMRANTEPGATLLAGERLAYLANRESIAASPDELEALLFEDAPDYVVAGSTLPWQMLREAIWFRLYYEPRQRFGDPGAVQAQKEVYSFRPPEEWLGAVELLNARIPDRMSLLGYQMDPQPVVNGQPVNLALHMQRPQASLATPAPFRAIVRLAAPLDGHTAGEWSVDLPRSMAAESWQPEQVIVEQFQIRPPQDLESAAYTLNISFADANNDAELWPVSFNNDVNRLDRIPLGYVIVPWTGSMDGATPLTAGFAQGIQLMGFEQGEAKAGEALDVTLYWQTSDAVDETYAIFVHVLDGDGQLVANHDGPPANGLFPTDAWLPGMIVPDTHAVPLPAELASGDYDVRVGLYDPVTGERLPVQFIDGQPVEGDSVRLGVVNLR